MELSSLTAMSHNFVSDVTTGKRFTRSAISHLHPEKSIGGQADDVTKHDQLFGLSSLPLHDVLYKFELIGLLGFRLSVLRSTPTFNGRKIN